MSISNYDANGPIVKRGGTIPQEFQGLATTTTANDNRTAIQIAIDPSSRLYEKKYKPRDLSVFMMIGARKIRVKQIILFPIADLLEGLDPKWALQYGDSIANLPNQDVPRYSYNKVYVDVEKVTRTYNFTYFDDSDLVLTNRLPMDHFNLQVEWYEGSIQDIESIAPSLQPESVFDVVGKAVHTMEGNGAKSPDEEISANEDANAMVAQPMDIDEKGRVWEDLPSSNLPSSKKKKTRGRKKKNDQKIE